MFAIGDLRIGESEDQTKTLEGEWEEYLVSKFGREGADEWLKIYHDEDMPESINSQIKWLEDAGFQAEMKWQKENLAVIIGKKL